MANIGHEEKDFGVQKRTSGVQTQHQNSFSTLSEKVCLHALIKQQFDMFLLF